MRRTDLDLRWKWNGFDSTRRRIRGKTYSEDMGCGSLIREVGIAKVVIEAGSTDAAEAAISYHAVSSHALSV